MEQKLSWFCLSDVPSPPICIPPFANALTAYRDLNALEQFC